MSKKFQVYSSTYQDLYKQNYVIDESDCWDNQILVAEANSLSELSRLFCHRIERYWTTNKRFYESNFIPGKNSYFEIHCFVNNDLKIFPLKFKDFYIEYPVPRGGDGLRERRREVALAQRRTSDGRKFKKDSSSEEDY